MILNYIFTYKFRLLDWIWSQVTFLAIYQHYCAQCWFGRLDNAKKNQNGLANWSSDLANHTVKAKSGVGSYFRRHEVALTRSHWQVKFQLLVFSGFLIMWLLKQMWFLFQIIQIICSKPGQFSAWVVVDGMMLKIPILVPRVFYLSFNGTTMEEFPGKRVIKTLPHGRLSCNLIEVLFVTNIVMISKYFLLFNQKCWSFETFCS